MKKSKLLFCAIILLSLLVSCVSESTPPEPPRIEDQVATIVAGTLSAIPTPTLLPTVVTLQPTDTPSVAPVPNLRLEDFPNKALLGENEGYSVYLITSSSGDAPEKIGEIIIYDKGKNLVYQILGSFKFFGTTIVSNDGKGEYILLSHGSYTSRTASVITLHDKKQAVSDFCTKEGESGSHLFWNNYVIFNNCDTFRNRPWGMGEAPSIMALNLQTGVITDIARSDLTHQFQIKTITGDNLEFLEISVEKEEDWQYPDNQITIMQNYNLPSLGPNN